MSELTSKEKVKLIVDAALERKAEQPVAIDISKLSSFADVFIVLNGRSNRQVSAIADGITRALKGAGERAIGVEGLDDGIWVLIDADDVIVHVFDPDARERYDLERLWSDGEKIDLELPVAIAIAITDGDASQDEGSRSVGEG